MLEKYTRVFEDAVRLMADCFDLELDEVRFEYELGACTKDVDLGWYQLPEGSLGGCYLKYVGIVGGVPRIEMHLEWQMTPHTDAAAGTSRAATSPRSRATPASTASTMILPKPGTDFSSPEAFASVGMTVTGMPALNADPRRRRRAARDRHQRRPPAAGLRRPLQATTDEPP